jgi:hypothetical protein
MGRSKGSKDKKDGESTDTEDLVNQLLRSTLHAERHRSRCSAIKQRLKKKKETRNKVKAGTVIKEKIDDIGKGGGEGDGEGGGGPDGKDGTGNSGAEATAAA